MSPTRAFQASEDKQTDEYFQFIPVAIEPAPCRLRHVETRLDKIVQELTGLRADVDDLPVLKATHGG